MLRGIYKNTWHWEWQIQRFRDRQYVEEHRFINFGQVSLHKAYERFFQGIEQIYDYLCQVFDPGDHVELHLEAVSIHESLYPLSFK